MKDFKRSRMKIQSKRDLERAAHHLIKYGNAVFYSDIADHLKIDLKEAVKIFGILVRKGLIRPRTKDEAETDTKRAVITQRGTKH